MTGSRSSADRVPLRLYITYRVPEHVLSRFPEFRSADWDGRHIPAALDGVPVLSASDLESFERSVRESELLERTTTALAPGLTAAQARWDELEAAPGPWKPVGSHVSAVVLWSFVLRWRLEAELSALLVTGPFAKPGPMPDWLRASGGVFLASLERASLPLLEYQWYAMGPGVAVSFVGGGSFRHRPAVRRVLQSRSARLTMDSMDEQGKVLADGQALAPLNSMGITRRRRGADAVSIPRVGPGVVGFMKPALTTVARQFGSFSSAWARLVLDIAMDHTGMKTPGPAGTGSAALLKDTATAAACVALHTLYGACVVAGLLTEQPTARRPKEAGSSLARLAQ